MLDTERILEQDRPTGVCPGAPDIEHLEILGLVGRGGMGAVYRAMDRQRGVVVALKVLGQELCLWDRHVQRFLREANNLITLSHPNIVKGYEVGRARSAVYFTMEFVEGKDLLSILRENGPFRLDEVIDIGKQALRALSYAFAKGKLHRDIKPANLMRTPDGTVKVSDFGLMKGEADPSLTSASVILGTPYYMSPEFVSGCPDVDIRTDIYSLGATLYHLLTGAPPFAGEDVSVVLTKQITDGLEIPPEVLGPSEDRFRYVFAKMVAKRRELRYETPDEVLADLEALVERPRQPKEAPPKPPAPGKAHDASDTLFRPPSREASRADFHAVLSERQIKAIAADKSAYKTFAPGQVLFYEKDNSRDFYILVSGRCEVLQGGKCLGTIDASGSCFGEMASILGVKRTATIRALGKSVCARMPAAKFKAFLIEHPEIQMPLLEIGLKRLCCANDRFVQSLDLIEDVRRQHLRLVGDMQDLSRDELTERMGGVQDHLDKIVSTFQAEV